MSLEVDPCPVELSSERQVVLKRRLSRDQGVKDLVKLCPDS